MVAAPTQQFNFKENKIEEMTLETLKRTVKEKDYDGQPVKGIFHSDAIERVGEICRKHNINYEIEEIFASSAGPKSMMGVSVAHELEEKYGENAIEAHILRRVYATVAIKDWDDEELTTNVAIAFHQDGLQIAVGPCVKICHNLCVLGAERSWKNYGQGKVPTEEMFNQLDEKLSKYETYMNEDRERIRRMKERIMKPEEVMQVIGMLVTNRVTHDSQQLNKRLPEEERVKEYALNQGQISAFTEALLILSLDKRLKGQMLTAWDLYNTATELYKPGKTEFPSLIPQNEAMAEMIINF